MRRCLLLFLLVATSARAGGFEIPELGVRRLAMGAVIGRPDDASALYHDPAGLVLADHWSVEVTSVVIFVHTAMQLHAWDQSDRFVGPAGPDGYYPTVRPTRGLGVIPLLAASGPIRDRLYGGVALYVGNGTGAQFDPNAVTRYHLIDGYFAAPKAVVGAAYQLTPTLALGATAGVVNFRIHGHRKIFPIVNGMDASSITGTAPDIVLDGSGWAPTWSIGAFGRPRPDVTWGAAVIGRVDATLEGPVTITYSDDAPNPGDKLVGIQQMAQLLPWTFHAGVNVDVSPHVEVGAEFRYWLYRQYKTQNTTISGIFLVRSIDQEKNWRDSWSPAAGIRLHDLPQAPALEVMAGISYDRTPSRPATQSFDTPTFDAWGGRFGARYSLGRWRLGAAYEHAILVVPTITNSITLPPSNLRGSGSVDLFSLSGELAL